MWKRRRQPKWKPEIFQVVAGAISRAWQNRIDHQVHASVGEHVDALAEAVVDAIDYEFEEREGRINWLEFEVTKMGGIIGHLSELHRPMQNRGASNTTKLNDTIVFAHTTPVQRVCQECAKPWPCPTYDVIKKVDLTS